MKIRIIYFVVLFFLMITWYSCAPTKSINRSDINNSMIFASNVSSKVVPEKGSLVCRNDTLHWILRPSKVYSEAVYVEFSAAPDCIVEEAFYGHAKSIDFLKFYFSTVDYRTNTLSRQFESKESASEWRYRGRDLFEAFLYNLASNHVCDEGCKSEIYLLILMDMIKEIKGYSSFHQTIDSMQLEVREGYGCECKQWKLTEDFIRKNYESGEITLKDFGEF